MPRFKYRNLLVDVLPDDDIPAEAQRIDCDLFASCGWTICLGCTGSPTACNQATIVGCPGASQCGGCTLQITPPPCDWTCSEIPSGACLPCTNITDVQPQRGSGPRELAVLRERLRSALAEVESKQQQQDERLRPRTVGEAEALEGHLNDALAALREQKEQLRRGEADG